MITRPVGTSGGGQTVELNVLDYAAKGDGVSDDTVALQNWLNAVTSGSCRGAMPARNYRITAPLTVGTGTGGSEHWSIEARGARITQATNNTPIFRFRKELCRRFLVDGLTFAWASNQVASNTSAVAILFDSDTDNNYGFYNFRMSNLRFVNGFRGICINEGSVNRNPVWGAEFDHFTHDSLMTGALLRLRQTTSGQPNAKLTNTYVRGDSNTDEAVVDLQGYHGLTIDGLEFNDVAGKQLLLTTCEAVDITNLRSERGTMSTPYNGLWTFSDVRGQISAIEVQSTTFTTASWAYIIRAISTNTHLVIGTASVSTLTVTNPGQVALVNADTAKAIEFQGAFRNGSSITKFYAFDDTRGKVVRDGNDFGGAGALLKEISGAGKTTVVDSDFVATPADRTAVLVRNTSDNSIKLAVRANGTWRYTSLV